MSDKCREAWEKIKDTPVPQEAIDFANGQEDATVITKQLIVGFHAGYHTRPMPTVEELQTVCAMASKQSHEADNERIARAIHRLMVEGEE